MTMRRSIHTRKRTRPFDGGPRPRGRRSAPPPRTWFSRPSGCSAGRLTCRSPASRRLVGHDHPSPVRRPRRPLPHKRTEHWGRWSLGRSARSRPRVPHRRLLGDSLRSLRCLDCRPPATRSRHVRCHWQPRVRPGQRPSGPGPRYRGPLGGSRHHPPARSMHVAFRRAGRRSDTPSPSAARTT